MWKKILASLFIGASLIAISSVGHSAALNNTAKTEQKVEAPKYQVTNPEKTSYSTEDKVAFIHGKAPAGTSIVIEVYGTTDLTRKSFNLHKLPTENDYIEVFTETIKSGNMGFFDKQLDLVTGINKIIIKFDVEDVPPVEIIVFVKPQETKEVKFIDIIQNLK